SGNWLVPPEHFAPACICGMCHAGLLEHGVATGSDFGVVKFRARAGHPYPCVFDVDLDAQGAARAIAANAEANREMGIGLSLRVSQRPRHPPFGDLRA